MNLRRLLLAFSLLALPAASASPAGAAEARVLSVRPVAPAEQILEQQRRGREPRAVPLTADEVRVQRARMERQRIAHDIKHEMMSRAQGVDRSLAASRRPGWRPPAATLVDPKTGRVPAFGSVVPVDTLRVAFLRIDFLADREGTASTGDGRFNLDRADTLVNPVDRPPHNRAFFVKHGEALSRYYDAQTYGRVRVEVDVWPTESDSAYHLSDMADLGPWRFGSGIFRAAVDMMKLCFYAADSQARLIGDPIPWNKYDRFMIIHAGSDLQSDLRADSKLDIPSFTMFVSDTDRVVFADTTLRPIDRVAFVPETLNQDDAFGAINGVIAHENGHNFFGFGDIYDISTALPTVGYWSLMDSGNLLGARLLTSQGEIYAVGLLPPSIDPFQRDFATISESGILSFRRPGAADTAAFALHGSQRTNDFVKLDLSSDEYLILENRYLAPAAAVRLKQDDSTRVVLGPLLPDTLEYDALLPGGGVLAWHVDESVIPFTTSLRVNPDFGFNSNPRRRGLQMIEADGLDDLGDVGSPYLLGSALDPWQAYVAPTLSDDTTPNLRPNQGTRPHLRIDFLDDASDTMHVRVRRTWQPAGWPVAASFPPGGPSLLTLDLDGDGARDVVWAGGDTSTAFGSRGADSAAVFAVRFDGRGLAGADSLDFAHLDRRPRREAAGWVTGDPATGRGPGVIVVTTHRYGASDVSGGRLWAVDADGATRAGFPVALPSPASTPPVVARTAAGIRILVGCEDGRVRAVDDAGTLVATSSVALPGPVSGRLAWAEDGPTATHGFVAAGDTTGQVGLWRLPSLDAVAGWPVQTGGHGFVPDFLFMASGGAGASADASCASEPTLHVHHANRVWAYCPVGAEPVPGWGAPLRDTLVAGLAAGDPDGDGFPEVVAQTVDSRVMFLNRTGQPSPGWPRAASAVEFRTSSAPVVVDVDGDARPEMVTLTASGVLNALGSNGRTAAGWPLATGSGCAGDMVATDLEADGTLEVVAPDRFGRLYAYSIGALASGTAAPWTMAGGDAGRTSSLPSARTSNPSAPSAGPLVNASLKAYPNPSRRQPVTIAYQLTEDATVEVRILDASGHEVTRWTRAGVRADNLDRWDPSGVPAGLYVAHLRFSGANGTRTATVPIGVLR